MIRVSVRIPYGDRIEEWVDNLESAKQLIKQWTNRHSYSYEDFTVESVVDYDVYKLMEE